MKSSLIILLSVCLLGSAGLQAQNSGLYGKKAYVEVTGIANYSLLNGITSHLNPLYKKEGSGLVLGKDRINTGLYLSAGIATKRNFAIGVEAGWWYFSIGGPSAVMGENPNNSNYVSLKHEMLDARTFSLMPVFTFGGDKGLLPVGINNEVGIGYTSTHIVDKSYLYQSGDGTYSQDYLDNLSSTHNGFVDYSQKFKGFMFMYGLKIRTPITNRVMINYGFRYTLNFTNSTGIYSSGNYKMNTIDVRQEIAATRFRSLVSLNLGVTLAL